MRFRGVDLEVEHRRKAQKLPVVASAVVHEYPGAGKSVHDSSVRAVQGPLSLNPECAI